MTQPQGWTNNVTITTTNTIPAMKRRRTNIDDITIKKARLMNSPPTTRIIRLLKKKDAATKEINVRARSPLKTIKAPSPPRSPFSNCHICHRIGTTINRLAACQDCGGSCCSVCQRTCMRTRPVKMLDEQVDTSNETSNENEDPLLDEGEYEDCEGCGRIICKTCSALDDDNGVLCIRCISDTQSPPSSHSASPRSA